MTSHKKMTMKKYENTAQDHRRDAAEAKKRGMTIAEWNASKLDRRMDRAAVNKMNQCTSKRGRKK